MRNILLLGLLMTLVGCMTTGTKVQFRPASDSPSAGLTEMTVAGSGKKVFIAQDVVLANEDFEFARLIQKPDGLQVEFVMSKTGIERYMRAKSDNRVKPFAILVNGRLICAPFTLEDCLVSGKITEFTFALGGYFSDQDARMIVDGINNK